MIPFYVIILFTYLFLILILIFKLDSENLKSDYSLSSLTSASASLLASGRSASTVTVHKLLGRGKFAAVYEASLSADVASVHRGSRGSDANNVSVSVSVSASTSVQNSSSSSSRSGSDGASKASRSRIVALKV